MSHSLFRPLRDRSSASAAATPVPEYKWALRCIELHAGGTDDAIRCTLRSSTIGNIHGCYEALSYTWGERSNSHDILVNGQPISITRNLETALRRLRVPQQNRTLWIDSVCINQGDIAEVNVQVQRMWAIYQHARRVLVFLGDEVDNSHQAFGLLTQLSHMAGFDHADHRITALLDDQKMDKHWEALSQLLRRPWWSRAWVIQEYVVAKSAVFQCGSMEMPGDTLEKAFDVMVKYRFSGLVPSRHFYLVRHTPPTPIYHMWTTRRMYHDAAITATNLTALNTLYRFRGSKSFDPRDKVYSLYRLIAENPKLAPDYTKRAQDLFKDVVGAMIESSGTLEVLSHHNRSSQAAAGLPDLPTWCPDWTVMRGKRILLWPNEYHAMGERHDSGSVLARIRLDTLTLKGTLVDRVRWLQSFKSEDFQDEQNIYAEVKVMEAVAVQGKDENVSKVVRRGSLDSTALGDAFRRTLVASRIRKAGPNNKATVLGPYDADELWHCWSSRLEGDSGDTNGEMASWYTEALYSALCGRAFFVSDGSRFGLVDEPAQVGDVVGVFLGAGVLLALREVAGTPTGSKATRYQLVGECYLHGLMAGEVHISPDDLSDIDLV